MADNYEVIIQPEAYSCLDAGFEYIANNDPVTAQQWLEGMITAIKSLETFPHRCPFAPENRFFADEIRQHFYGNGRHAYRILFTILGNSVSVLHIRHGARDTLKPKH